MLLKWFFFLTNQSGLQRVAVQAHIAHLTQFPRGIFVTYIHGTTPLRQIRSISGDTMWGRLDIVQQRSVINTGFVATTSFSGIGYLLTIIGCNKTLTWCLLLPIELWTLPVCRLWDRKSFLRDINVWIHHHLLEGKVLPYQGHTKAATLHSLKTTYQALNSFNSYCKFSYIQQTSQLNSLQDGVETKSPSYSFWEKLLSPCHPCNSERKQTCSQ